MFDLVRLSESWPRLVKYIKNNKIDLSIPEAQRELTCAIAYADYSLMLSIPKDSLVPVINNRIYYLKWIRNTLNQRDDAVGLDIGTGTSAIYPLLGSRLYPGWKWFATESNQDSFEFGKMNIKRNNLESKITILHTSEYFPVELELENIDFVMTNPPFYGSEEELSSGNKRKRLSKKYIPGSSHELYTKGGEFQFVFQIIEECLIRKKFGIWFSCLIGKKENWTRLYKILSQNHNNVDIRSGNFNLGKTRRWLLAWKFLEKEKCINTLEIL